MVKFRSWVEREVAFFSRIFTVAFSYYKPLLISGRIPDIQQFNNKKPFKQTFIWTFFDNIVIFYRNIRLSGQIYGWISGMNTPDIRYLALLLTLT